MGQAQGAHEGSSRLAVPLPEHPLCPASGFPPSPGRGWAGDAAPATRAAGGGGGRRGGVGPAGGIMNLINERGVPVVLLGQSPNNQGGAIIVNNQGGNQVVSVTCDSDDAGAIRVMDAEAKKYNTVLPRSRPGMSGQ